jgi:hypothetical protein
MPVIGTLLAAMLTLVPVGTGNMSAASPRSPGHHARSSGGLASSVPARDLTPKLSSAQVIADLAIEGVGVYASASSPTPIDPVTAPVVPLQILKSQADVDAEETVTHEGTLGADLNRLAPMPTPPAGGAYAPFAYLLSAYATAGTTPGEQLAGQLLGTQDWTHPEQIVFPDLVLTLFTADALRAAGTANGPDTRSAANDGAEPGISLCGTLADWISQNMNKAFSALTASPSSNSLLSYLGGLWNSAVTYARSAIANIVSTLSAPVVSAIQSGIGTVGVAAAAVSTLRNLSATASAAPAFNTFGVDPESEVTGTGLSGKVTVTLGNAKGFDWPTGLTQCASQLGVTLPSLNSVDGSTVDWNMTQVDGVPTTSWCTGSQTCVLATQDASGTQTTLQSDHTADFAYLTNTELADQDARGAKISGPDAILVSAVVTLDTAKLRSLIQGLVLGAVPGAVKIVAGPMFDALTNAVLNQIASLAQPITFRYVLIDHHEIPAQLTARSCNGLYSTIDFPGTVNETVNKDGASSECDFTPPSCEQPCDQESGGVVGLETWPLLVLAQDAYAGLTSTGSFVPIEGVGDQAAGATVKYSCGNSICQGTEAVVRIANDVLDITQLAPGSPTAATLIAQGVPRICPTCKFPTSPLPS